MKSRIKLAIYIITHIVQISCHLYLPYRIIMKHL